MTRRAATALRHVRTQAAGSVFEDVAGGLSLVVLLIAGLNLPALL